MEMDHSATQLICINDAAELSWTRQIHEATKHAYFLSHDWNTESKESKSNLFARCGLHHLFQLVSPRRPTSHRSSQP